MNDLAQPANQETIDLLSNPPPPKPWPELTNREAEVADMLSLGSTNRVIAKKLGISVKTVDTHRGHVLEKLKLANNVLLARYAISKGYVA